MRNSNLIDYINKNYSKLINYGYKFFNDKQSAEDCIQKMYVKFLTRDYGDVKNVRSFVHEALYSQFYNFKRTNRRYSLRWEYNDTLEFQDNTPSVPKEVKDKIILNDFFSDLEELDEKEFRLNKLNENLSLLPENQKNAIERRLNGTNPQTNTEKANYRHGMLKLKKLMAEG